MKVCVYCASSKKIHKEYFQAAEALALEFLRADVSLVYGGGASGLMGQLADTMLAGGGKVRGIMPRFMNAVEWAHQGVSDMEFTETMHERKAKFLEEVDALVALPGGTGTLEEVLEAISLKKLGQFVKPIVILNTRSFYDPLLAMLEKCAGENFIARRHLEMWSVVKEAQDVLPAIENAPPWDENAIDFAAIH